MLRLFRKSDPIKRLDEIVVEIRDSKDPKIVFQKRRNEIRDMYHGFYNQPLQPDHSSFLKLLVATKHIVEKISKNTALATLDPESIRKSKPELMDFLDDNRGPIQRAMMRVLNSYTDIKKEFANFPPADLFPVEMGYMVSRLSPEPLVLAKVLDNLTFSGADTSPFAHHHRVALYHAAEAFLTRHPAMFVKGDFAFKWLKQADEYGYDSNSLVTKHEDKIVEGFHQLYLEDSENFYEQLEKFIQKFPNLFEQEGQQELVELRKLYELGKINACFTALAEQQAVKQGLPANPKSTVNLNDAFKVVSGIIAVRKASPSHNNEYQPLDGVFTFSGGPDHETRLVAMRRPVKTDITSGEARAMFILERNGSIISATFEWEKMMEFASVAQDMGWPQPHDLRVVGESFGLNQT